MYIQKKKYSSFYLYFIFCKLKVEKFGKKIQHTTPLEYIILFN